MKWNERRESFTAFERRLLYAALELLEDVLDCILLNSLRDVSLSA